MKKHSSLNLALLGYPAEHSLSPSLFYYFAQRAEREIYYHILSLNRIDDINRTLTQAFEILNLNAINITSPYKSAVYQLIQNPNTALQNIKVANILWQKNDLWEGENTDLIGAKALCNAMQLKTLKLPIVVLGAGGGARTIGEILSHEDVDFFYSNRTHEKALELAQLYGANLLKFEELKYIDFPHIILSCLPHYTPLPELSVEQIRSVGDIAYVPSAISLLAKQWGIPYTSGYSWLFAQAVANYQIVTGDVQTKFPLCPIESLPRVELVQTTWSENLKTDRTIKHYLLKE